MIKVIKEFLEKKWEEVDSEDEAAIEVKEVFKQMQIV